MAARSRFGAPRAAIQGAIVVLSLVCLFPASTQAYDALDPLGNITIVWDVSKFLGDGYEATVHIWNNQYFKKVEEPGWALRWNWTKGEMIWAISGAEATEKGDCPARGLPTPGGKDPHNCEESPTIVDLPPPLTGPANQGNCCRGGVMSSLMLEDGMAMSTFALTVGNASSTPYDLVPPANFTLNLEGYTCTPPIRVEPSVVNTDGRRNTQALATWNITCTYSQRSDTAVAKCCVSLSAFYNDTIIPCTNCACACGNFSSSADICTSANSPFLVQTGEDGRSTKPLTSMECSPDGCPISVHYHVKVNYELYWRAKVTIVNRNLYKNYTDWNVVLEHPAFNNFTEVYSWEGRQFQPFGVNNSAVFWGMAEYNDVLMPAGPKGNVQSEMLFAKDSAFTFSNGWAFPRRVVFNGEECILPEVFPTLPSGTLRVQAPIPLIVGAAVALMVLLLSF